MVHRYLILLVILTFLLSFVSVRFWISRAKHAKLVAKDVHKLDSREVAEMGGLPILFAFAVGVFAFVAIRVFVFQSQDFIVPIFAVLLSVFIAGIIGIVDDILGWKIGLAQWQKPVLTLLCAFPIMAVDAGTRIMFIPFFGNIDLGLIYPLLVIPLFLVVASNGTNMLAGFNGLESGLSMIMVSVIGFLSWKVGASYVAVLCAIFLACVFAFWVFNKYPARIFPGDTFTYSAGAFIAAVAIFADLEKALIILFIPFAIEFFLKLRGRFKKESFGRVLEDGSLDLRYSKFYGLEHVMIWVSKNLFGKATERRVVYLLYGFQLIFVVLAFIL
ncbi:hypothetical protein HOC01_05985 [archaeon]|jgi:UDP-N-acetylglucosamine--dolichyl-phosphate N-acetylglucosaminephosphotransferase|nr:hypothetical protein [archaeon]MBT6697608.1 hypothetical protein [archaeon]